MTTYIFTDLQESKEITANTFRGALRKARAIFKYRGNLRLIAECGNYREYGLQGYTYCFSIRKID